MLFSEEFFFQISIPTHNCWSSKTSSTKATIAGSIKVYRRTAISVEEQSALGNKNFPNAIK